MTWGINIMHKHECPDGHMQCPSDSGCHTQERPVAYMALELYSWSLVQLHTPTEWRIHRPAAQGYWGCAHKLDSHCRRDPCLIPTDLNKLQATAEESFGRYMAVLR